MTATNENLTHFAVFVVKAHGELSFSLEVGPKPKGTPSEVHDKLVDEFPEVYYFVEGDVESFDYRLESKRLYRLPYGRAVQLQTQEGMKIYAVTGSHLVSIPMTRCILPYRKIEEGTETKEFRGLDFRHLNTSISMFGRKQTEVIADLSTQIKKLDFKRNKRFIKATRSIETVYRLQVFKTQYSFRTFHYRDCLKLEPSENWYYPRLKQLVSKLNYRRREAQQNKQQGPRVLVWGPLNSGKGGTLRLLMNRAINQGWRPMLVETNVGQNSLGLPGTVGLAKLTAPFDVEQCIGQECHFEQGYPVLFHYGSTTAETAPEMYWYALTGLMKREVAIRQAEQKKVAEDNANSVHVGNSGVVVNTHGWVTGFGFTSVLQLIAKLKIDHIFVHGDKEAHANLFYQLFGVNYNQYELFLAQELDKLPRRFTASRDKMSKLLEMNQVYFVPTNISQRNRNNGVRFQLRKAKIVAQFGSLARNSVQIVSVSVKQLYKIVRQPDVNRSDKPTKCHILTAAHKKVSLWLYTCGGEIFKNTHRVISIMTVRKNEIGDCCVSFKKCLPISRLFCVESFARIVGLDNESESNKLLVEVPAHLAADLLAEQLFMLLNDERVSSGF